MNLPLEMWPFKPYPEEFGCVEGCRSKSLSGATLSRYLQVTIQSTTGLPRIPMEFGRQDLDQSPPAEPVPSMNS